LKKQDYGIIIIKLIYFCLFRSVGFQNWKFAPLGGWRIARENAGAKLPQEFLDRRVQNWHGGAKNAEKDLAVWVYFGARTVVAVSHHWGARRLRPLVAPMGHDFGHLGGMGDWGVCVPAPETQRARSDYPAAVGQTAVHAAKGGKKSHREHRDGECGGISSVRAGGFWRGNLRAARINILHLYSRPTHLLKFFSSKFVPRRGVGLEEQKMLECVFWGLFALVALVAAVVIKTGKGDWL